MTEFTTASIFDALKKLLGVIDNPERRSQLEDYIEAARPPLDQAVFDLLSGFAEAVNTEVAAHYEVTLGYRTGVLNLEVRAREPSEPTEEAWPVAEGDVEKITLRLPADLKDLATEAAAKAGLSVNAWLVRVLARAVRSAEAPEPPAGDRPRRRRRHGGLGGRLTGWVGPEA
ncbi:MAG: toxin-antitoxin system HicB family antitoxin [Chloroflexi bacterium]|nr:toxin-antitoxin system HicB family antitoxin [Chloroflexota bacterium]